MVLLERQIGRLLNDLEDNVDWTYKGWSPSLKVWRAGEPHPQSLPYVVVDNMPVPDPKFQSLADVLGRENNDYYK